MTDADVAVISQSTITLPGKWYLDPLIDRRHARPRAWIRADELGDHHVDAIGLERSAGLVFVTICCDDEDEREALPNMVFETVEKAMSSLRLYLEFPVCKDMARRHRRQGAINGRWQQP